MAARLQIEFQVTKTGLPQQISDHFSTLLKSKSDQIPPAYMCNKEKLVFIIFEKVDKVLREYVESLDTSKTENIAYVSVFGQGDDELKKISESKGVNVAGVYDVGVKKGLFGGGKLTQEELDGAVGFAKKTAESLFESLHL